MINYTLQKRYKAPNYIIRKKKLKKLASYCSSQHVACILFCFEHYSDNYNFEIFTLCLPDDLNSSIKLFDWQIIVIDNNLLWASNQQIWVKIKSFAEIELDIVLIVTFLMQNFSSEYNLKFLQQLDKTFIMLMVSLTMNLK